jgi:hypothetical protein
VCNPLVPRIDKNLGNPRGEKGCRSVSLRIVGGYEFYPSTTSIGLYQQGFESQITRVIHL